MGRNGGLSGPGKGRLFLPGEGSRRQWWSLAAHDGNGAKAGTRGKETSQCRSNGYLDYCIEAVVQEMEGCSGNPVTKSGLSLGRLEWVVVWVRVAARELVLAWCCGTRGVEQPMSSVETAFKQTDLSRRERRQVGVRGRTGGRTRRRWALRKREKGR